jgi:hypothetical protein
MGFSGGGSNVLKPHTHLHNIAQDGGALDMDGVTQGSLTAGDLIYSDGSNLQRLAIGGSGQSLTSSGSAPQWSAASGAAVEFVASTELGSDSATMPLTWSSIPFNDYSMVSVTFNVWAVLANDLEIKLQNPVLSGSSYITERMSIQGGASGFSTDTRTTGTRLPIGNQKHFAGRIDIFGGDTTSTDDKRLMWNYHVSTNDQASLCLGSGYYSGSTTETDSTGISFNQSGGNLRAGSTCTAYKYSRT